MRLNAFLDTGTGVAEPIVVHSYDNNKYAEVTRQSGDTDWLKRGYIYKDAALTIRFGTCVWDKLGGQSFKYKSRRSGHNSNAYYVYVCDRDYNELTDKTAEHNFGRLREFKTRAELFSVVSNFLKANQGYNILCEGAISRKAMHSYGPAFSAWFDPQLGCTIRTVTRGAGIRRGGKFVRGYGKGPKRNPQFYKK